MQHALVQDPEDFPTTICRQKGFSYFFASPVRGFLDSGNLIWSSWCYSEYQPQGTIDYNLVIAEDEIGKTLSPGIHKIAGQLGSRPPEPGAQDSAVEAPGSWSFQNPSIKEGRCQQLQQKDLYFEPSLIRAPNGHINIRILQTMIFGNTPCLGP